MNPFKIAAFLLCIAPAAAVANTQCQEQVASGHHAKICLDNPGMFKHYQISLEVDQEPIFVLIDDYSENINLTHTVPDGIAIELPISRQGKKTVSITGGCVPVINAEGSEIARKCNLMWGNVAIIKNVFFSE